MIQSISFFVPEYILKGLMDGSLIRKNGLIYNNTGQIVQHLQEVSQVTPFISTGAIVISASTVAIVSVALMIVVKQFNIIKKKLDNINDTLQNISLKLDEIITNQVHNVIKDIHHGWNCLQEQDYLDAQKLFRKGRSNIESFLFHHPDYSIRHNQLYNLLLQSYELNFKFEMIALTIGKDENITKLNTVYNDYVDFLSKIKKSYKDTYLNNPYNYNALVLKRNFHPTFAFEKTIQETKPQTLLNFTKSVNILLKDEHLSQELSLEDQTITLKISQ